MGIKQSLFLPVFNDFIISSLMVLFISSNSDCLISSLIYSSVF